MGRGAGEDELRAASGAASGDGCAGSRPTTVLGATMGFDPGGGEGRRGGDVRGRLCGGMTATWRRRWGDGIGGLPRSRSGKGEREEWERMGATWGWGLGFQGDKVEWEGPAGPVGWSGGPSACWAEA